MLAWVRLRSRDPRSGRVPTRLVTRLCRVGVCTYPRYLPPTRAQSVEIGLFTRFTDVIFSLHLTQNPTQVPLIKYSP